MSASPTVDSTAARSGQRSKSRIRVLLVAPSMDILGGQAVQATRLLACLGEDPSLEVGFQPINPRLPGPLRGIQAIKYVRTAATLAAYCCLILTRAWYYDVLHVFSASYTSYILGTLPALACAKLYGKKIILNYRDGQAEDHLLNWRTALSTIRRMDAVVTPSSFLAHVFAKFGVHAQPIFNIIDMRKFKFRRRRRPRPVFLHNRILEPIYNVGCTLRAFQIVQRKYPEARLTVAHDGICRAELERLALDLGLRNTYFVGRVSHDRIGDLYDGADIYLTSPDFDCMPGSLLECFASGLPVIATMAGGIPYIAVNEETALLVPPGDHEAMAKCAFRLLEEESLADKITRSAYEACKGYSPALVCDQWRQLYKQLTGKGATR